MGRGRGPRRFLAYPVRLRVRADDGLVLAMPTETLILCACDRRYAQTKTVQAETEQGSALCVCGRTLGAWDGGYSLHFEPEMDEDDPLPTARS